MLLNHIPWLSGFKKIHIFEFTFSLTGTIIPTPDSVYGIVKSTYNDLLYMIVMSATAMSYLCNSNSQLYLYFLKNDCTKIKYYYCEIQIIQQCALLYSRKGRKLVVNIHLMGKLCAGHSIFSGILIEDKGKFMFAARH